MRDVELIKEGERYGIQDNKELTVPCIYEEPIDTIQEWEYFEKLNTKSDTRFLNHVTPLEEIESIVNKLKSKI